jgi:hypothetical protein
VEEGEFKLAQLCGLNIIINADDLAEVGGAGGALPGAAKWGKAVWRRWRALWELIIALSRKLFLCLVKTGCTRA